MAKCYEDEAFANKMCKLVFDNYERLGKKGKPVAGREWTILSAVVAVFEQEQGKGMKYWSTLCVCYCIYLKFEWR